jgi:hypothetical protein
VQEVIQLARKCGISNVASINTHNIHPSSHYGIGVDGVERVEGRKIRRDSLQVIHPSWMGTNWHPKSQHINVGKFWAEPKLTTWEHTTFEVGIQTLRIRLNDDLPVETADELLAAIAAGKIRFADQKARDAWEDVELTRLVEIAQRVPGSSIPNLYSGEITKLLAQPGGEFHFSFSKRPLYWVTFSCEFKNGEIVVKNTGLIMI